MTLSWNLFQKTDVDTFFTVWNELKTHENQDWQNNPFVLLKHLKPKFYLCTTQLQTTFGHVLFGATFLLFTLGPIWNIFGFNYVYRLSDLMFAFWRDLITFLLGLRNQPLYRRCLLKLKPHSSFMKHTQRKQTGAGLVLLMEEILYHRGCRKHRK